MNLISKKRYWEARIAIFRKIRLVDPYFFPQEFHKFSTKLF
jgi:hypothetical protein